MFPRTFDWDQVLCAIQELCLSLRRRIISITLMCYISVRNHPIKLPAILLYWTFRIAMIDPEGTPLTYFGILKRNGSKRGNGQNDYLAGQTSPLIG